MKRLTAILLAGWMIAGCSSLAALKGSSESPQMCPAMRPIDRPMMVPDGEGVINNSGQTAYMVTDDALKEVLHYLESLKAVAGCQ